MFYTLTWRFEDGKEQSVAGSADDLRTVKFALRQYWPQMKYKLRTGSGRVATADWLEPTETMDF